MNSSNDMKNEEEQKNENRCPLCYTELMKRGTRETCPRCSWCSNCAD